jgi:hypothetical protein
MHYFAIAIVVFVIALVIALAGCGRQGNAEPASRAAIAKKLVILAESKPPANLVCGAMCYEPVSQPDQLTYVCPACNAKTVYAVNGSSSIPIGGGSL